MIKDELLQQMSEDMGILRFSEETNAAYAARLMFSSLACWANQFAQDKLLIIDESNDGVDRVSKNHITTKINEILTNMLKIFPECAEYFEETKNKRQIASLIRNTYENLGYFISDKQPRFLRLANYARVIKVDDKYLYFGPYRKDGNVVGLGLYKKQMSLEDSLSNVNDVLLRQNMESIDIVKQIITNGAPHLYNKQSECLEFLSNYNSPSSSFQTSWSDKIDTKYCLARNAAMTFNTIDYLACKGDGEEVYLYTLPSLYSQNEGLNKYEYNRLVYGVRAYHGFPQYAYLNNGDDKYFILKLTQDLPYREQIFLLMLGWPLKSWHDRFNYLIPTRHKNDVKMLLAALNIKFIEEV